jgi:hypothetical protein
VLGDRFVTQTTHTSSTGRCGRNKAWALVAVGFLLAGGCGLGDYEAEVRKEQARLEFIDRENDNLGEPLERPLKSEKEKTPVPGDVFLRPPKGINKKPSDKPPIGGLLYDYSRHKGSIKHVYLAWDEKGKVKDFRDKVWSALGNLHIQKKQLSLVTFKPRPPVRSKTPPKVEYATYDTKDADNKDVRYYINFYPEISGQDKSPDDELFQVAVIFAAEIAQSDDPEQRVVSRASLDEMDYSLATLAVGGAATGLRSIYSHAPPAAAKGK